MALSDFHGANKTCPNEMDKIEAQIDKIYAKIDIIEEYLQKPFREWTEEEIETYGNKEQLRKQKEQLIELCILKEKEKQSQQGIPIFLILVLPENTVLKRLFKEALEEHEHSSSSSKRSKKLQEDFRHRIEARDEKCVISGSTDYQACHIVPFNFWYRNPGLWDNMFGPKCLDPNHGIDDIRNGLLLSKKWHTHFDFPAYRITIVFIKGKYKVKPCTWYPFSAEEKPFLEKELVFYGIKDIWPGKKFLKYHNDEFEKKDAAERKKLMKAKGDDPKLEDEEDSDATIGQRFGSMDYGKQKWIKTQDIKYYTDPEVAAEIPLDSVDFLNSLDSL